MESLRDNPMLTTASMPIPARGRIAADFSEFGLMLESSSSPQLFQDLGIPSNSGMMDNIGYNSNQQGTNSNLNNSQMWNDLSSSIITLKSEPFHMDEDDIFQVDKNDLIQGPTLAELNDDTLLEDLNIDDLINLPNDNYIYANHTNLHQLQPVLLNVSLPPHQLLQSQNNFFNNQNGGVQSGIAFGQDVLYDDQTNISNNSFDMYQNATTPTKSSLLNFNSLATFSPGSHHSSNSSLLLNNSITPPPQQSSMCPLSPQQQQMQQQTNQQNQLKKQLNSNDMLKHFNQQQSSSQAFSTLHSLLKQEYSSSPDRLVLGQSVPSAGPSGSFISGNALSPGSSGGGGNLSGNGSLILNNRRQLLSQFHGNSNGGGTISSNQNPSRLSSSAPTRIGLDQIWQRREPRQHLLSTGSLAEAGSTSSLSTGGVLSPEAQDFSHDEGYSDDDDSEHYEDYSSDDSDDDTPRNHNNNLHISKKERFFWQYNVQAKGPKGQRLVIKKQMEDPHILNEITDPVFSPHCSVRGIKHSGKARKGDGNDLTPNPRKLHNIGKELDKLGRIINDMTPVSELPFNVRPKTRKEKNKLASRACRLKKKAQHEANKIKLQGLEIEHKRILNGIGQVKNILVNKCNQPATDMTGEELNVQLEKIVRSATKLKVAGNSTEFVNKILEKIRGGVPIGALEEY